MSINFDIYNSVDAYGAIWNVEVRATILFSPSEGYNAEKIGELKRDLGPYITTRLNAALKKGGEE